MPENKKEFKPTYFLTDEQIKNYQKWSSVQVFEWLESTNEFLFKLRTPEAKAFNKKLREGKI